MPILNDILDHAVIGPAIRQGREKGLQEGLEKGLQDGLKEGRQQGRQEGRQQGRQEIVSQLLERRFGALPDSTRARLTTLSAADLDNLALRILDATSLDELFPLKP